MSAPGCVEFDDVVAELALGTLPGDQRAVGLAHAAACAHCRGALEEFSDVADSLLLLAPEITPPPAVVAAVAARLRPGPGSRWRRVAVVAAAAVVIAAGLGLTTDMAGRQAPVRVSAMSALGVRSAQFVATGTESVDGQVFAHAGRQSWVLMTVHDSWDGEPYRCEVDLRGDRRLDLGTVHLDERNGSWGRPIPVDAGAIQRVRLVSPTGTTFAVAAFA